jgi:hypothetical protein
MRRPMHGEGNIFSTYPIRAPSMARLGGTPLDISIIRVDPIAKCAYMKEEHGYTPDAISKQEKNFRTTTEKTTSMNI